MNKYSQLDKAVSSVFASDSWKQKGILTHPENFTGKNVTDTFIRISTLPSANGLTRSSVNGIILIDIFIPADVGPTRSRLIADELDSHLAGKSIVVEGGHLQMHASTLSKGKPDTANPSLFHVTYTIPFNFFGA